MHFKTKAVQALAAVALLSTVMLSAPKPASADQTSTLLLGAAAIAGVVIYENVAHKQQDANRIVGYTTQGFPVYADGHVGQGVAQTNTTNAPTIGCTQGQSCNGPYTGSVSRRNGNGYGSGSGTGTEYSNATYGGGRWANRENRSRY